MMLTAKELAETLSVSSESVYRWAADDKIPSYRLPGGGLRFNLEAVLRELQYDPEEAA